MLRQASVLLLALSSLAAADQESYTFNIYLTASKPRMAALGKWVFDISSPERLNDMVAELARLGVNAMTYHSAYRIDGADYQPKDPSLKRATRWPPDVRPVAMFLDACARHRIAGYLAVFLTEINPPVARAASLDIINVFRGRPGMAGFVPPIEGSAARGQGNASFLAICREVKRRAPELRIMDYPNGPYSPGIVQLIVERAASGFIDIENVQYHAADERLRNFVVSRGMAHLVMGMCSRSKPIVHTHYKYGGGKAWLKQKDAYKVRQAAVITATPYGTSIFSFQHAMWGEETGPGRGPALWRRLVWYEGILAVQRQLPTYHAAVNISPVAVLIPAHTADGGKDLVERYWLPFARARIPVRMFAYSNQLSPETRVVICPSLEACDARQRRGLEQFVRRGGLAIVATRRWSFRDHDMSPRARRILGRIETPRIPAGSLSPDFLKALGGAAPGGFLPPVQQPERRPLGRGEIVRAPAEPSWLAAHLVELAEPVLPRRVRAENLPEDYVLESWRTSPANGSSRLILLYATRPASRAKAVRLRIPWSETAPPPAWFFDRSRAAPLRGRLAGRELHLSLPEINDEYGMILLGRTAAPTLQPTPLAVRTRVAGQAALVCTVINTTGRPASGTVALSLPRGWRSVSGGRFAYQLQPGESAAWRVSVRVPEDAERRPYFAVFTDGKQAQRSIIFPENGRPQVISHQPPPPAPKKTNRRVWTLLGDDWKGVTAGEPNDASFARHIPGVCFLPQSKEWDPPARFKGKMCRYAEILPRLGGANFFVNGVDSKSDLLVRITYCAKTNGRLEAYDGEKYHVVGRLPKTDAWKTLTFRVPKEIAASPRADKHWRPGLNLLFQVSVNGVYVHRIEARRAPASPNGPAAAGPLPHPDRRK